MARSFDNDIVATIALLGTKGIGPTTLYQLVEKYGAANEAYQVLEKETKRELRELDYGERVLKQIYSFGAHAISHTDERYPASLKVLNDAPPVLFVKGRVELLKQPIVALVGSRNASMSGRKLAYRIAKDLSDKDYIVASGLARGIDTSAHEGSLKRGTIAVLAGGLDNIYPPENSELYHKIATDGLLVSESPIGMKPIARHFPKRNRIVAGLSLGTAVIEAAKRSGSLITADQAFGYGREVFAVPGNPGDPRAAGGDYLIKSQRATLIEDADDILTIVKQMRELPKPIKKAASSTPLLDTVDSEVEEKSTTVTAANKNASLEEEILQRLSKTPIEINDLVRDLGTSASQLMSELLEMEINGTVQKHPGNKISLAD